MRAIIESDVMGYHKRVGLYQMKQNIQIDERLLLKAHRSHRVLNINDLFIVFKLHLIGLTISMLLTVSESCIK